jgi:hypothetical protein
MMKAGGTLMPSRAISHNCVPFIPKIAGDEKKGVSM